MASIAMNLTDIRAFVRDHLDVDDEELPNSLLDRFIIDGADRIERASVALGGRWSFRQVTYAFNSASTQQAYSLDTTSGLGGAGIIPLALVEDVRGPTYSLTPSDHRAQRARYSTSAASTGTPRWFSTWGRSLYLWPTPSGAEAFQVSGYRQGNDWVSTNAAPDFPDEFHELIATWALTRSYIQQDDPEMAAFLRDEFAHTLKERAAPYIYGDDQQPFALNRSSSTQQITTNPSGLVYPFLH